MHAKLVVSQGAFLGGRGNLEKLHLPLEQRWEPRSSATSPQPV